MHMFNNIDYKSYKFSVDAIKEIEDIIKFSTILKMIDETTSTRCEVNEYVMNDNMFYEINVFNGKCNIFNRPKIKIDSLPRQTGKTTKLKKIMTEYILKDIKCCYITPTIRMAQEHMKMFEHRDKVVHGNVECVLNSLRGCDFTSIGIFIDEPFCINENEKDKFFEYLDILEHKKIPYFVIGYGTEREKTNKRSFEYYI